jgi:hypothetical protein
VKSTRNWKSRALKKRLLKLQNQFQEIKLVEGIFADLGAGSGLRKAPARQTAAHSERATLDANLGSMFNAD